MSPTGADVAAPLLLHVSTMGMGRADDGFTAIEIMIVVAIAGIVAGVSIPSISGAMQTSDDTLGRGSRLTGQQSAASKWHVGARTPSRNSTSGDTRRRPGGVN